MAKPLLTAIIFTYNHKNTITRCIESHLNQNTSYDYIIKIYDDCSNDGTSAICREFARQYPDKIKVKIQKENAFTKPYEEMQSYQAISEIDTKYFCICDGDDYWCSENKVQKALDFLENHPEYHGWAHDTYNENTRLNYKRTSYLHDDCKYETIENPVKLSAKAPFFYVSSRVFRTSDYPEFKIPPIDYLNYYYHLAQGPFYFHDEIMAVYSIGENNTYFNLSTEFIIDNSALMPYRLSKLFKFKQDKFCTELLLEYETRHNVIWKKNRYRNLCKLKKIFGKRLGWHLWAIYNFAFKYGFEILDTRYIYDRKKILQNRNKNQRNKDCVKEIELRIKNKYNTNRIIKFILKHFGFLPEKITKKLEHSIERKYKKMLELNKLKISIIKQEKI